jgi:hypothetical protein
MRREQSAIRWFARWLVLVAVLALGISACGEREARIDTGPQVRLKVGDATYAEPVYSYCWPQTDENVACDVNLAARAQPARLAPVAPGEPISFDVGETEQDPQAITVTLLDGPGGQTHLAASSTGATFTSPTEPGQYRVQIDVQYAEVSGSEAYVSYVFGLDVQAVAVAAAPTETPVEAGAAAATEAATEEPVEVATEEPTEAPTEEPTAAPTLTPQEVATEAITETVEAEPTETEEAAAIAQVTEEVTAEAAVGATEEATEEATIMTAAPTEEPTETPTADATAEVIVELTKAATEEATTQEAPTPTSEPAVTEVATEESTPEPTAEPTQEPTQEPAISPTPEGSLGSVSLLGNVRVVRDQATVPLANATVTFTHRSASDPSRDRTVQTTTDDTGRFTFEPVELYEADTVGLTISAAGYSTQEIELNGADAYSLPVLNLILLPVTVPTPTPSPTISPTATPVPVEPTPTPTPVAPPTAYPSGAPLLSLAYAGRAYEPLGYQFCQPDNTGALSACVQEPTGTAERRRLALMRGAAAQLLIAGGRPSSVHIEYLTDTGVKTGQPEDRPGDNTILFTVLPEPGPYILAVTVTWDAQQVTYYFRVAVSG